MKQTLYQAERAMCYCEYRRASSLLKHALNQARQKGDRDLHNLISEALNESRRRHILGVLRCIKKIRIIVFKKGAKS